MKDPIHLAQDCGFKSIRELSSYGDVIVPDIVYQAAFVAHNYFLVPYSHFNSHDGSFIEPLNTRFRECQMQHRCKYLMDIDLVDPLKVLITYYSNEKVREFTDNVVKLCTKPTFIPVLNGPVSTPGQSGTISPWAFILAHAVQILLFAPQDWKPNRVYSRNQGAYPHRFPTPEAIGGGTTRTLAGLFSVEDLYRAVLLFYCLLKRRSAPKWITKTAPTSSSNAEFLGYHHPTSPSVDQDAHQNLNEPGVSETSPSVSNELPKANEVDAVPVNNESDQSDKDEDDSDYPDEDVSESEGVDENENEDENENDQSNEDNNESNQGDENENESEQADEDEDEDADVPESLNETETIEGLKTIRINTLLLESLTTTCPSESLSQRLRDLSELKSEFESSMSTSTKDETHVPLDLEITDMKHLIKRPSNASANSEINQPSPMILVKECRFQWDIPHYPEIDDLGHAQSPGHENHPTSKSLEHRKAVLNCSTGGTRNFSSWRNPLPGYCRYRKVYHETASRSGN
ncbi:hypothetical protein ACKLNR_009360 [Fusarium oxysporum f. sp. zingiberi]